MNEPKAPSPFRPYCVNGIEVSVRYARYGCARDFDGEPYVSDHGRTVLVGPHVEAFILAPPASALYQ